MSEVKEIKKIILKENLLNLLVSLGMLFGGILLNIIVYYIGYYVLILLFIPILGLLGVVIFLSRLLFLNQNEAYKCFHNYKDEKNIIKKINSLINSTEKDFISLNLIIVNNWLILPKEFIFVKTKDINWFYTNEKKSYLHMHTNFGLKFGFEIQNAIYRDKNTNNNVINVEEYINIISHFCNKSIYGFRKELELKWNKNPQNINKESLKYLN